MVSSFNTLYYSPCKAGNKLRQNPFPCFKSPEILMSFLWVSGFLRGQWLHTLIFQHPALCVRFRDGVPHSSSSHLISHSPLFLWEQMQRQLAYLLGPFKRKAASFLVTCDLFCFCGLTQMLMLQFGGAAPDHPHRPALPLRLLPRADLQ